jgi:hypothetical protein
MAELVVTERGEEGRVARELRELDRRHRTATRRLLPVLGDVEDLSASREMRNADEVGPLHVTDHAEPESLEALQ